MQVLLRIANGKSNVRKVRIQSDTVIGRSPECQLKVASNQISRRHCQIVIRDTVVAIKDLGSANGTFVNGRQVPPEVEIPLTPGTRVMLGPLQFTVEYDLPGMSATRGTAPASAEEIASEDAGTTSGGDTEHQLQVDTAEIIPSSGATPMPGYINVPSQSPPQHYPSTATPVAIAAAPSPAILDANVMPPAIWSAPVPQPSPAAAILIPPSIPLPPPVAAAAVVAPPAIVTPQIVAPAVETSAAIDEEANGGFNFGIFAASGSGIIVESAREIPMMTIPVSAEAPKPAPSAKKGLLQLFGWGKKKAPVPAPEPANAAPIVAPEFVAPEGYEELSMEETAPLEAAAQEDEALFFNLPAESKDAPQAAPPDGSLPDFFNFK
ncbi:MAG: FHA domain-containing protein [Planctomycetota bacterium]